MRYAVTNKCTVQQNPLSDAPDVPPGTFGIIDDYDSMAELYAVDFGDPYGSVLCRACELNLSGKGR